MCFKGFTGTTYANFQGTKNTVVSLFIFFILPYFTCHPSLYCVIALLLQAASFFILPWLPTTGGLISEDIFNFDPILRSSRNKKDINDVTAAPFSVSFSQLLAAKKTPKTGQL